MEREKIFKIFFKCNDQGEQNFNDFNQLTPIGKRLTYIITDYLVANIA